jgi:hypothetical protein
MALKIFLKVSGFALNNYLNSVTIDTDLFKFYVNQILKNKSEKCFINQFRKKGNLKKMKIESKIERITFSNDLSKRRFINTNSTNYCTFPYGYLASDI